MGIIRSSKYQALVVGGPKATNGKEKQNNELPMEKEHSNEALGSRRSKKNGKGKILCSYCGRGFHPKSTFMRRTIDKMALLINKYNIIIPASVRKADHREETEEHEDTCHALKASCSTSHRLPH